MEKSPIINLVFSTIMSHSDTDQEYENNDTQSGHIYLGAQETNVWIHFEIVKNIKNRNPNTTLSIVSQNHFINQFFRGSLGSV